MHPCHCTQGANYTGEVLAVWFFVAHEALPELHNILASEYKEYYPHGLKSRNPYSAHMTDMSEECWDKVLTQLNDGSGSGSGSGTSGSGSRHTVAFKIHQRGGDLVHVPPGYGHVVINRKVLACVIHVVCYQCCTHVLYPCVVPMLLP